MDIDWPKKKLSEVVINAYYGEIILPDFQRNKERYLIEETSHIFRTLSEILPRNLK